LLLLDTGVKISISSVTR